MIWLTRMDGVFRMTPRDNFLVNPDWIIHVEPSSRRGVGARVHIAREGWVDVSQNWQAIERAIDAERGKKSEQ